MPRPPTGLYLQIKKGCEVLTGLCHYDSTDDLIRRGRGQSCASAPTAPAQRKGHVSTQAAEGVHDTGRQASPGSNLNSTLTLVCKPLEFRENKFLLLKLSV